MADTKFAELYSDLIDAVYADDLSSQRYYLSAVESYRNISVDYLFSRGCIFIPNNDYIKHYLGDRAMQWGSEFYRNDFCLWSLYFIIPIQDLSGETVGIVGWDLQNKYKEISEGEQGLPMYKVSSKNVFSRESYFLTDPALLKRTFDSRTIFVTDGVFDSMSLNYRGIPAISLLGSSFSREVLYFLRWYKKVYIVPDNDTAGLQLYSKLKSSLPNVRRVIQKRTKDIEELLRGEGVDGPVTQQLLSCLSTDVTGDIVIP